MLIINMGLHTQKKNEEKKIKSQKLQNFWSLKIIIMIITMMMMMMVAACKNSSYLKKKKYLCAM